MPNLVLDLDALPPPLIREYDASSEDANMGTKYQVTAQQLYAREKAGEILAMVDQRRQVTPQMVTSPVNPWRVTHHDTMSVALRGILEDAVPRPSGLRAFENVSEPPIVRLTQSHKTIYSSHPEHTLHPDILQKTRPSSDTTLTGIESLVVRGDPRRRPDFIKEVRSQSGIPPHTTKNEQNLLRWMMVKQEAGHLSRNADARSRSRPPTSNEVVQALESQESIAGVRRIVFQCIAGGMDVNRARTSRDADTSKKIPVVIRDACARILDRSGSETRHQDILGFVNNLAQAVPRHGKDLSDCILGLRLRCLAEMGLLDFTAQALEAPADGVAKLTKSTDVAIAEDVKITLETWAQALEKSDGLQTASQRRQLFRIASPTAAAGNRDASLQSILSQIPERSSKSRACKPYITLLGCLGAPRTLYMEWKGLVRDLKGNDDEDEIATHFLRSLFTAARKLESNPQGSVSTMDLGQCVALDEKSICSREEELSIGGGSEKEAPPSIAFQTLDDVMHLPFDRCIAAVRKYCQQY